MTPEWGSAARDVPPETQFLLLELQEGGPYAVLLPMIDNNVFRSTLRPAKCALYLVIWVLVAFFAMAAVSLYSLINFHR